MTQQITVNKSVLIYVMEQLYTKAYSDGEKGLQTGFNPDTIRTLAEQFTNDVEKYSNAKSRF